MCGVRNKTPEHLGAGLRNIRVMLLAAVVDIVLDCNVVVTLGSFGNILVSAPTNTNIVRTLG
jgi:hypothetical protein